MSDTERPPPTQEQRDAFARVLAELYPEGIAAMLPDGAWEQCLREVEAQVARAICGANVRPPGCPEP